MDIFLLSLKGGHVKVEQSEEEVCTKFAQLCMLCYCHFGSLPGIRCSLFYLFVLLSLHVKLITIVVSL